MERVCLVSSEAKIFDTSWAVKAEIADYPVVTHYNKDECMWLWMGFGRHTVKLIPLERVKPAIIENKQNLPLEQSIFSLQTVHFLYNITVVCPQMLLHSPMPRILGQKYRKSARDTT